jgi:hypothetical protein
LIPQVAFAARWTETPALASNVCDTRWSMEDLVALVDRHDEAKRRQKPGRKPKAKP